MVVACASILGACFTRQNSGLANKTWDCALAGALPGVERSARAAGAVKSPRSKNCPFCSPTMWLSDVQHFNMQPATTASVCFTHYPSMLGNVPELGEQAGCISRGLSWPIRSGVSSNAPRAPFSEATPPPPPWLTLLCGFPKWARAGGSCQSWIGGGLGSAGRSLAHALGRRRLRPGVWGPRRWSGANGPVANEGLGRDGPVGQVSAGDHGSATVLPR